MENTTNVGLFAVHKIVSEYAERTYAYMENTQKASPCVLLLHQET